MTTEYLAHAIEAILFVTGDSVAVGDLTRALDAPELDIRQAIDCLADECAEKRRGICVKRFADRIQLTTQAEYAPFIERMLQPVQKQSLSKSALETLSIVAYRQPVTKLEVEAIRGVKCDYSIQSLTAKNLIMEVGRKETLGRPILYGTTDAFLSHFGLERIEDLPPMEEAQEQEEEPEELIP